MRPNKNFNIDIVQLKQGIHLFEYELDDEFFSSIENTLIEKGHLKATLQLDSSDTMIKLYSTLKGHISLICDVSLDEFEYPIEREDHLILKFSDRNEVLDEEIELIKFDTQKINVANYLYEFAALSIPIKKLHPRFEEEGSSQAYIDGILRKVNGPASEEENKEDTHNPFIDKLKNLNLN